MKKRTAGVVNSARPNWQRNVLSKAIAMAGAGLQASAAMAACPTTAVNSAQTTICVVSTGQTATITNTGSITASPFAIAVSGTGSQAVVNDGTLTGEFVGVFDGGSGTLTIDNNTSGVISAEFSGIYITSAADLVLTNAGTISAGGSATTWAAGVYLDGSLGGSITNSGSIAASAVGTFFSSPWAGGIYVGGDLAGSVDNSGSITAAASGSASSTIAATGIYVGGELSGSLTNSGSINATASDSAFVIFANGVVVDSSVSGSLTNSGSISATAVGSAFAAVARGIAVGDVDGSLSNSGTISAYASNTTYQAYARGISVDGSITGTLTNSGEIGATAIGFGYVSATGIYVSSSIDAGGTLTNAGSINALALSGGFSESAYAAGILVDSELNGTVDNQGTISATASTAAWATADGINVYSLLSSGSVTNSGTIDVSAVASSRASAAGIYVDQPLAGTIDNSGAIMVNAAASITENFVWGYAGGIWLSSSMASGASVTNSGSIDVTVGADGAEGAGIVVFGDVDGAIANSGTMDVAATGAAFANAGGVAVYGSLGADGSITNSGVISATANAASSAQAFGVYVSGATDGMIDNSGTIGSTTGAMISATANGTGGGTAAGIWLDGPVGADASVTGGVISVLTGQTSVPHTLAFGEGYGIRVNGVVDGSIDTDGQTSVTVDTVVGGAAYGIDVNSIGSTGSVTNSTAPDSVTGVPGGMTVTANVLGYTFNSAYAAGMFAGSIADGGSLTNSGVLNVNAYATLIANATGIAVGGLSGAAAITNSGTMTVAATYDIYWANAEGISVESMDGGSITNSATGAITATADLYVATPTQASTGSYFAHAAGIDVGTMGSTATITNNGAITVRATINSLLEPSPTPPALVGGTATGIRVYSMQTGSSLVNSGTISATGGATVVRGSSESSLFAIGGGAGIVVSNLSGGATLSNSGTINARAPSPSAPGSGWAMIVWNGYSTAEMGLPVISNSGIMRGNVLLNNASLNNTGTLSLPAGAGLPGTYSYINNGNYVQTGAGVLETNITAVLDPTTLQVTDWLYGRLSVNGTADFLTDGHLAVNATSTAVQHFSAGQVFDNVVSAGTLDSGGTSNLFVTDNTPIWNFTAIDDGENGIDIMVSPQVNNFLTAQGAQIANVNLDALQSQVMGRMDVRRLVQRNGGHDQNLWFRPYGAWASQDNSGNTVGFDVNTFGMVIGYDTYMSDSDWNVGAALSYANSSVETKSSVPKNQINTDLISGSVYGYGNLSPDTFVDLMAIFGYGKNDTTRDTATSVGTVNGNYNSWYTRLSSAIGRNFQMNDQWTFTPIGTLSYTYVSADSYKESGGPANVTYDVDSSDADSLIFSLDAVLSYQWSPSALFTAHVGGGYDALTDSVSVDATLNSGIGTVTSKSDSPEDWLATAGVGAEFVAGDTVEIHLNYDYEYRNDFDNNQVVATLRWKM